MSSYTVISTDYEDYILCLSYTNTKYIKLQLKPTFTFINVKRIKLPDSTVSLSFLITQLLYYKLTIHTIVQEL